MILASSLADGRLGGIVMILAYAAVIGFFYLVLIRPQSKREKQHRELMDTVETGDCILTSSGFYGVVIDVDEDVVIVEFGKNKNCRIPMKKDAIVEIEKPDKEQ